MKKTNILLQIAGALMIIIGILEIIRGFQLLETGKTFQMDTANISDVGDLKIVGIGMILVAFLFVICGVGVIMKGQFFWWLSVIAIILYVADGIINSKLLFSEALGTGVSIDMTIGILLLILLYLGKKRL
ncbi:MAG: hypothetical protein ABI462_02155 [Ignavibacteria bacterium]